MPEAEPHLVLERPDAGIAVLRFNRPEALNALTDVMVADFGRMLDEVARDTTLRVLILTGSGRAFCAGFDLSLAGSAPGEVEHGEATAWLLRQEAFAGLVMKLRGLRQPVIAAINGTANGAGLALALGCEMRIAARAARFNAAFVKVGLAGCDMGVSWLLPRAIGTSRAFDMLLTGRMVDAMEADRIGLVSELVEDGQVVSRALEIARAIASNSAFGMWLTKRGTWANLETASFSAAMELENRTQMLARTTGELAERAAAFRARRKGEHGA